MGKFYRAGKGIMTEKEFLETSKQQKLRICKLHSFECCQIATYRNIEGQYEADGIYLVTKLATGDYLVKDVSTDEKFVMKLSYKNGKVQAARI